MQVNSTSTNTNTDYSRITGLATGMDTDGMVKKMLSYDNIKLDKIKQDKQEIEWKQEEYVDIIKDLKDFQNSFLNILAPSDTNIMKSSAYAGLKADVVNSNTGVCSNSVRINTLDGAQKGNYKIKINNLAQGAILRGIKFDSSVNLNTKLKDINGADFENGKLKFTVDKDSFEVNVDTNENLGKFLNDIRSAKNSNNKILGNLLDVNYSELTHKLTFQTIETGEKSSLKIENQNLNGNLNFLGEKSTSKSVNGMDSSIEITPPNSNTSIKVIKSTNLFTIDNVEYDISSGNAGDFVDVRIYPDATDKVKVFKNFIEKYNSLIDKLKNKIEQKRNYKFNPLTDAQKKEMSKDEIKNWEAEAKKGLISEDSTISNLLSQLRSTFYDTIKGTGLSANQIGITTTNNWRDGGKLVLDENTFKHALETKGEQVEKLFTQRSNDFSSKGILQRFKESFDKCIGVDGILIKKAGYKDTRWVINNTLSKMIQERTKYIKDMQKKINDKQQMYYKMFAELEKNMNTLNSQSNWLMSQLS